MDLERGHATPEGTASYAARFEDASRHGGYRQHDGLTLSSIGIGTYLGDADHDTQVRYVRSIATAIAGGLNVVDTAINYRHMMSERAVRDAVRTGIEEGAIRRDEVFVSTKGGFLAYDATHQDPRQDIAERYFRTGILTPENFVANCHSLDPRFLKDQLARSRANLGLDTIDLYYVHNPGTQSDAVGQEALLGRLLDAFRMLEDEVAARHIASYGLATWDSLRAAPEASTHLPLERIVALAADAAREAGHARSSFLAVQAPLNLAMAEAARVPTQVVDGERMTLLAACAKLGLGCFSSGSILQGRLAKAVPVEIKSTMPGITEAAMTALQATRSAPGLTTALVGMSRETHVASAVGLLSGHAPDAAHVWQG